MLEEEEEEKGHGRGVFTAILRVDKGDSEREHLTRSSKKCFIPFYSEKTLRPEYVRVSLPPPARSLVRVVGLGLELGTYTCHIPSFCYCCVVKNSPSQNSPSLAFSYCGCVA